MDSRTKAYDAIQEFHRLAKEGVLDLRMKALADALDALFQYVAQIEIDAAGRKPN